MLFRFFSVKACNIADRLFSGLSDSYSIIFLLLCTKNNKKVGLGV